MHDSSLWKITVVIMLIIAIILIQLSSASSISFRKFTRIARYDNMISTNNQLLFLVAKSLNHCGTRCSKEGETCKSFFFGREMNLCHLYSEDVFNLSLTPLATTSGALYSRQGSITGHVNNDPSLSTIPPPAVPSVLVESAPFLSDSIINIHSEVNIGVSFTSMSTHAPNSDQTAPVTLLQIVSSADLEVSQSDGGLLEVATAKDISTHAPNSGQTAPVTLLQIGSSADLEVSQSEGGLLEVATAKDISTHAPNSGQTAPVTLLQIGSSADLEVSQSKGGLVEGATASTTDVRHIHSLTSLDSLSPSPSVVSVTRRLQAIEGTTSCFTEYCQTEPETIGPDDTRTGQDSVTGHRDNDPLQSVLSTMPPSAVPSVLVESAPFLSDSIINIHSEVNIGVSFTSMSTHALNSEQTTPVTLLQIGSLADLEGSQSEGGLLEVATAKVISTHAPNSGQAAPVTLLQIGSSADLEVSQSEGGLLEVATASTTDVRDIYSLTTSLHSLSPSPPDVSVTHTPAIEGTTSCCQTETETNEPDGTETNTLDDTEPGDTVTHGPDDTEPCDTETGEPGDTETGEPDDTETGEPDDTETDKPGDAETGEPDDTETGEPDDTETGEPDNTEPDDTEPDE